jgi:hypothetical protein
MTEQELEDIIERMCSNPNMKSRCSEINTFKTKLMNGAYDREFKYFYNFNFNFPAYTWIVSAEYHKRITYNNNYKVFKTEDVKEGIKYYVANKLIEGGIRI